MAFSLSLASTADAGDPRSDSRAAFVRGVDEAHQEHFIAARDAFLEAYRLFAHPSILLNLGVARMHTGEYLAAEEDLRRFLTDDGGAGPEELANARATLSVVRKHIGTLRLRVHPNGARAKLDGVLLPLTPGAYVDVRAVIGPAKLRIEAEGYAPDERQVVIAHDSPVVIDAQLTRGAGALDTSEASSLGRATGSSRTLGWGLLGGAAAATSVGIIAGVEAIALAHDFNTPGSPGYQASGTKSEGIAWRTSADVFFATAIGLAAAGTYFVMRPTLSTVSAHAVLGPGMVGVVGEF